MLACSLSIAYFTGEFLIEQDVSGSKVSVNEALFWQVAHAIGDVLGELYKETGDHVRQFSLAHSAGDNIRSMKLSWRQVINETK